MQVIYLMVKAYGADKSSQHHSVLHRCRRAWARRALLRTLRLFCACGSSIRWTQAIWSRINLYWCISGANGLISINFAGLWIIAIRKRGRVLQRGSASPAVLGRGRCLPSCISPHLKASHFDYCLFFSFFFPNLFNLMIPQVSSLVKSRRADGLFFVLHRDTSKAALSFLMHRELYL